MLLSGKRIEKQLFVMNALVLLFCANSFLAFRIEPLLILPVAVLLIVANVQPLISSAKFPSLRVRICNHGVKCLSLFWICTVISVIIQLILIVTFYRIVGWYSALLSVVQCVVVLAILFWNGMICVYTTSIQLGLKTRILGIICGLIPIANLIMLRIIIRKTRDECVFEVKKHLVDLERKEEKICATKYPVLMVHGVFFRDTVFFNYWGRIPAALEKNGARVFYGGHESAASIHDSAMELAERIETIIRKTGAEKVNIIAHSKGGLDCRYVIEHTQAREHIASLTTINTPHRGCEFADYLLGAIPAEMQNKVADTYNKAMRKLGDDNPDFMAAVRNLTHEHCKHFDAETPLPEEIYCRCVGSIQNKASGGKFPNNFTYALAKYFDGPNDGLVGESSFQFCPEYTLLTTQGKRGISHCDIIDMNREDIPGFDVREFYVQLVADLKKKGL